MIEISRQSYGPQLSIKVLGLGGAGSNAIDRLVLDGFDGGEVFALNTDVQSLAASVAPLKVHLGKNTTRGLGAGGDPELGYAAVEEAAAEIETSVSGANLVFICAGLGGGTGSGAAPMIANLARRAGATVIALVTTPFAFEGKRRIIQANDSLAELRRQANIVICFPNDRLGEVTAPTAGIQQAFAAADHLLSQSIRSIARLVQTRSLISIGLDDLSATLSKQNEGCLFGHGEAEGSNRAHEALERAMRNPLMDKGRMLEEARHVIVHIAGGADLTLNEVTILMEEFKRHISDEARIHFGVSSDAKFGKRILFTVFGAVGVAEPESAVVAPISTQSIAPAPPKEPAPTPRRDSGVHTPTPLREPAPITPSEQALPVRPVREYRFESHSEFEEIPDEEIRDEEMLSQELVLEVETPPASKPVKRPREIAPVKTAAPLNESSVSPIPPSLDPKATQASASKKENKVEQMQFEQVNRGRFEKSEPTIVDGQDLDVPTFLRRNFKLK